MSSRRQSNSTVSFAKLTSHGSGGGVFKHLHGMTVRRWLDRREKKHKSSPELCLARALCSLNTGLDSQLVESSSWKALSVGSAIVSGSGAATSGRGRSLTQRTILAVTALRRYIRS